MQYSSRKPYDFGAGGKGFDLLRMRIFSERYHFKLNMKSNRCRLISEEANTCPGNVEECARTRHSADCLDSGGTTVTVQFYPAERFVKDQGREV
jgi:hypothetical protein